MKKTFQILFILFLVFLAGGCSLEERHARITPPFLNPNTGIVGANGPIKTETVKGLLANQSKVKKFNNYEELADFLKNAETTPSYGYSRTMMKDVASVDFGMGMPMTESAGFAVKNSVARDEKLAENAENDFSQTNIQVVGVDEADIIKTDGNRIYAVSKNNLFIISADPALDDEVLSKIEFKSPPQDIFINGDSLVVFGQDAEIYNNEVYQKFRRRSEFVFFKVFDIKDPKNPKQVRDLDFEGSYQDSRMIGDYVYFVTTKYDYSYLDGEPILPRTMSDGSVLSSICGDASVKCFAPEVYYFNIPYETHNFTTVTAVNVRNNEENLSGESYLLSGAQNMYVSANNIYITYTKYVSEYQLEMEVAREIFFPRLRPTDQENIKKIEQADAVLLSENEKNAKIQVIIERYIAVLSDDEQKKMEEELSAAMKKKYDDIASELEKTVIHKIAIDKNNLEYKATGEVTGSTLNQFSMDEQGAYFRIATTKNRTWSRFAEKEDTSYSNLYVLDENLKQVGAVEKLAPGERIYSVRFMQNRAYMVTFKQTDPLFVIDLKNPEKPTVLGELKIPGFSNYLHPYDENTLIGIGKETTENEWGGVITKGVKLSLFDVSDVKSPKEINTYVLGEAGSDSIALSDHKAFLFSKEKNLLVIPASVRVKDDDQYFGKEIFNGAVVFEVTRDGFKLRGKITHSDGMKKDDNYWGGPFYYDQNVQRSLYIKDVLYTFSNRYLKLNKLSDLQPIKDIPLEKEIDFKDDFNITN